MTHDNNMHGSSVLKFLSLPRTRIQWHYFKILGQLVWVKLKETKSATMNIFEFFYFVFKSFVKVELSYVFTINLFTIAENCAEK